MNPIRTFQTSPRIVLGAGCLSQIASEVERLGGTRVMIVTDPGLVAAGIVDRLEALLRDGGVAFCRFDQVEPDPRLEIASMATDLIQQEQSDLIIGIGGGSAIDIAKIASVLATNDGDLGQYFGIDLIPRPGLKTIIVPTTAGTGSEVTPIVILSDLEEKLKKGVVSAYLMPNVALLDAELLAEVYLAMTRGQNSLEIEFDSPVIDYSMGGTRQRPPLAVLQASAEELADHARVLDEIARANKGLCLWRDLESPQTT